VASAAAVVVGNGTVMLADRGGSAAVKRRACPARSRSDDDPKPSTSITAALRTVGRPSTDGCPCIAAKEPVNTSASDGVSPRSAGSMGAIL